MEPRASFDSSRAQGPQRFSTAQAQADLNREDQRFRHAQEEKDNNQRRMIVYLVLAFLLVAAVASFLAAVYAENTDTRSWARDIVTGLVGGVVGVVLGLATSRPRS